MLGERGSAVLVALDDAAATVLGPLLPSGVAHAPSSGVAGAEAEYETAQAQLRSGAHRSAAELTPLLQARDGCRDRLADSVAVAARALARGSDDRAAKLAACQEQLGAITRFLAGRNDGDPGDASHNIAAALQAFRAWLAENDGNALAARTEAAAAAFREGGSKAMALLFTDQSAGAAAEFDRLRQAAHDAFTAELAFWTERPERLAAAPVQLIVSAARSAAAGLSQVVVDLHAEEQEQHRLARQLIILQKLKDVNVEDIKASFSKGAKAVRRARQSVDRIALEANIASEDFADGDIDAEELAESRGRLSGARGKLRSAQDQLHRQLLRIVDRAKQLPELLGLFQASVDVLVPPTLVPIWNPEHTLSCYSEYEEMGRAAAGRPGHVIYKARLGNRSVVVKQYQIDKHTAAKNMRSFFNEVSILCKLKSPYVAQVEQIFVSSAHIFVQMPHYSLGNLLQWASAEAAPPVDVARRCLHQVAAGLHHLHHLGVVHCDIKPENVFIDADGRPRIGDFDVSVDVSTRTTIGHTTSTAQVGAAGTVGYMAPEVLHGSTGCSTKTDVFAYGATLDTVMVKTLKSTDAGLLALIKVLTATDPVARPTAAALVNHGYFAADLQWRRQELRECVVCFDEDVPLEGGGLECSSDPDNRHFTCSVCLGRMVGTYSEEDVATLKQRQSKIPCMCGLGSISTISPAVPNAMPPHARHVAVPADWMPICACNPTSFPICGFRPGRHPRSPSVLQRRGLGPAGLGRDI